MLKLLAVDGFSLNDLHVFSPSYLDAKEENRAREKHATQMDATIRAAFVEMLALIFR